jgi:hypothetical protein
VRACARADERERRQTGKQNERGDQQREVMLEERLLLRQERE